MADNLPAPESRAESYLAKAAGEDVTIPEKPLSRTEQYLAAIAEGGGGTSYTAGSGITISDDTISVDTTTIQPKLTAGSNITISEENVISASGGSSVNVVQSTGTSTTDVMSQNAVTSTFYKDPATQEIVKIGKGAAAGSTRNVSIGYYATANNDYSVAVGGQSYAPNSSATAIGAQCNAQSDYSVSLGRGATVYSNSIYSMALGANSNANATADYSVALGAYATATRAGELNVGTGTNTYGYNSTTYRVIGGVHDGQLAHDAVTVGQINATIDAINTALNTSIPHIGA